MTAGSTCKSIYRIGGIAALLAAILFRRNIGAEVSLFTGVEAIPGSACCNPIHFWVCLYWLCSICSIIFWKD